MSLLISWKRWNNEKSTKTILFCIINPHLIVMLIIGGLLLASHKTLHYISDKTDDAARFMKKIDHKLGAKNCWAWCDFLVDDKQSKVK